MEITASGQAFPSVAALKFCFQQRSNPHPYTPWWPQLFCILHLSCYVISTPLHLFWPHSPSNSISHSLTARQDDQTPADHTHILTHQTAKQSRWPLSSHHRLLAETEGEKTNPKLTSPAKELFPQTAAPPSPLPLHRALLMLLRRYRSYHWQTEKLQLPTSCCLPTGKQEQGKAIRPFMTFNRNSILRVFFQQFLHSKS